MIEPTERSMPASRDDHRHADADDHDYADLGEIHRQGLHGGEMGREDEVEDEQRDQRRERADMAGATAWRRCRPRGREPTPGTGEGAF